MKRIACFLAAVSLSAASSAATWNFLTSDDKTLFFFDSESVVKKRTTVTVWIKQVTDQNRIGPDGVATAVFRDTFDCKERTLQVMQSVNYGKDGSVVATYPNPQLPTEPAPDTYASGFLKVACTSDFPEGNHPDLYVPVTNNDVATFSTNYFRYLSNQRNDPAPKGTSVTWYTLTKTLPHSVYFFVPDSVVRRNDIVTLWVKYVNDPAFPDSDGSYSTAFKESFDCKNRTLSGLAVVTYSKDQFVMSLNQEAQPATPIVPDSWADDARSVFCLADFPQLAHPDLYFPATNNDIYAHSTAWFASIAAKQGVAEKN